MCEPVTIASAAALAAGTVMSGVGRQQANKAYFGAANAEGTRQRAFGEQAYGAFTRGLDKMEPGTEQASLKDAQAKRTAAAQANVTNFSAIPAGGVGTAPKVITDAYERGAKSARDYGLDYGARTGTLEGYGDRLFSRGVDIGRTRQDIDKYGNFSRGSMSVLPVELEGAQTKGSSLRGWGELFSGLGSLGLTYGFTRPAATSGAKPATTGRMGFPYFGGPR